VKVAVIADTHFGSRNDNRTIQHHQEYFLANIFFPVIKKLGIKHVIHLGDLVEKRKGIDFVTLKFMREHFFEPLVELDVRIDIICGNHDTYFKSTNDTNALSELLYGYDYNVRTIIEPTTRKFDDRTVLYVPWITPDNHHTTLDKIKETKATTAFGHLELVGFEYFRGQTSTRGLSRDIFKKFNHVWSGHFHQSSMQGNISYVGAPYEMTWNDAGCQRGFGIWTPKTNGWLPLRNPKTVFDYIEYEDGMKPPNVKDKYIKLSIGSSSNTIGFDMFRSELQDKGPADLKVDDIPVVIDDEQIDVEAKDTQSVMIDSINALQRDDAVQIQELMMDIYKEATVMVNE